MIENPWVIRESALTGVKMNDLKTYLQEQFGQLGEDLIIESLLKSCFKANKWDFSQVRYLEIGANHPIQTSNTYLFAKKWKGKGILIEANPSLISVLKRVRSSDVVLNYAVVPVGYPEKVSLNIAAHSELSSVDLAHIESFDEMGKVSGCVDVESVTIDEVLESCFPHGLHLLSIDIEGLDFDVLKTASLKIRPVLIVVELSTHYFVHSEQDFDKMMRAKGYIEAARTDYNVIWRDNLKG